MTLRYLGPNPGSIESLANALADGESYLAKIPSFSMICMGLSLVRTASKSGFPARYSVRARSIALVEDALQ